VSVGETGAKAIDHVELPLTFTGNPAHQFDDGVILDLMELQGLCSEKGNKVILDAVPIVLVGGWR
jgi:hypothetical protein